MLNPQKTNKPKTNKPKTTKPKTNKPKTNKPKTNKPKIIKSNIYLYNGGIFNSIFQKSRNLAKIQESLATGAKTYLDQNGNVTNSPTSIISNSVRSNKNKQDNIARKEINITLADINIIRSLLAEFKTYNYNELQKNPKLLKNIENLLTLNSFFGINPYNIISKIQKINYELSIPPLIYNIELQNNLNNLILRAPKSNIELYNINGISLTANDIINFRRFYVKYAKIFLENLTIKSNIESLLKINNFSIFNFSNPIIKNLQKINYEISIDPLIYNKMFQYEFHNILEKYSNIKIMTISNKSITLGILLSFRAFYVKYAYELLKNTIIKDSIYSLLKINLTSFMNFSPFGNPIIKNLNNIDSEILKINNSALQNDYINLLGKIPSFKVFTMK